MSTKLSKKDEHVLKILNHMKLQATKEETITFENLSSIIIKTMRLVENIKNIVGSEKKNTVVDIVILLIKQYGDENLHVEVGTLENMTESLFNTGVFNLKKKCCI